MRQTVYGMVLAVLLATPLAAQDRNIEIEGVIENQIDAFRADDYDLAWTFASPTIKGLFGSPERFGQMVRNGYPMVDKPKTVTMLELRDVGGQLWQRVMVTDGAGQTHTLDYQMVESGEGWQINAVQLLPQVGIGV